MPNIILIFLKVKDDYLNIFIHCWREDTLLFILNLVNNRILDSRTEDEF